MYHSRGRGVFFIMVDGDLPDHIRKTFHLKASGGFEENQTPPGIVAVVREGEKIPDDLNYAVIIYHKSQWHEQQVDDLIDQITDLSRGCICVAIGIDADGPATDMRDQALQYYAYSP